MPPAVGVRPPVHIAPKSNAESKEWSSTFPRLVDKEEDSRKFMGRCLYLAFVHILESRRLMPVETFKKRVVKDIAKTYVMDIRHPLGLRIADKFRGAQNALNEGYLSELMIVVSKNQDDPDDAIEVFAWKMVYGEDGSCLSQFTDGDRKVYATLQYRGMEHVKQQTRSLLLLARKLCREILSPLPADAYATLRITYTDRTPKGYQADGFYRSETLFNIHPEAKEVNIGALATPHHRCLFSAKSIYIEDEYVVEERLKEGQDMGISDESLNNSLNNSFVAGDMDLGARQNEEVPQPEKESVSQVAGKKGEERSDASTESVEKPGKRRVTRRSRAAETVETARETLGDSPVVYPSSGTPPSDEPRSRRSIRNKRHSSPLAAPVLNKKFSLGRTNKATELTPGNSPPRK